MLFYNFKYDFKKLIRSKWIQVLSITLLVLFFFAINNGSKKVDKINATISSAVSEQKENDAMMLKLLDSIDNGLSVSASRWTIPSNPMAVANYHPRVVAKKSLPLAFMATGQSDLFTHYVKPTASGDDVALNFTEMTSPVQLLFGSFDMAFVIVYLLPLIIIAFTYNVLSYERESGSLRILGSQPINLRVWLLQKLGLRLFWLLALIVISLTFTIVLFGYNPLSNTLSYVTLFGLISAYMLFWFALAFLVNIWIGDSAKNAVSLLGLWIVFVLLTPSVLNQLSTTIYPIPSRNLMINNIRTLKGEVAKKQDEILDNYLRDHPEYAINDSTQARNFYHRYMASQQLLKDELQPEIQRFEDQLTKQQMWLDNFKWLSPAIITQESLNKLSGTSSENYEAYRQQVIHFSEKWRNHFMPLLYNNNAFTKQDYANLPQFEYQSESNFISLNILVVVLISIVVLILGFILARDIEKNKILIQT